MKAHWLVITGAVLLTVLVGVATALIAWRTQSALSLSYETNGQPIARSFQLSLGQSVAAIKNITITPEVAGEWYRQTDPFGVTGLEFRPKQAFEPGREYHVTVGGITRHLTGSTSGVSLRFTTEEAPGVLSFSVPKQEDAVVAADHVFTIALTHTDTAKRDIVLESEPAAEFKREATDDGYVWRPASLLPQGGKLELRVKESGKDDVMLRRTVRVADAPTIAAVSKEVDVVQGDTIEVTFAKPIDQKTVSDDALHFSLSGQGAWKNDTTYAFTPEGLEPAKDYSYRVPAGIRTKEGGVLVAPIEKMFSTRGHVAITSVAPVGRELSQGKQHIKLVFNQPVHKPSVEQRFHISSGTLSDFSWDGTAAVTATVVNLGYQTRVSVSLDAGVVPEGFGAASLAWGYSFTTESRTVKLAVPYYKQAHAQSCEAASLRMALAYRGVQDSDWNILQKFGYAPTHWNKETTVWDDPNQRFVGDVNGSQGAGTGWGVYAGPVSRASQSYGRPTTLAHGANAQFVAQQIHAGNPVIVWGIWGASAKIQSWTTPEGKQVSGPIPMHVRLIVGVKGEPGSPLGFYVHDPITGPTYWTTAQFVSNTAAAGPAAQLLAIQ